MTTTLITGAVTQLWHHLVRDAESRAHIDLAETQESYLVFTLVGHCRDSLLPGRILSLELLEGLADTGSGREERLRNVGDRCLLLAGLFPDQARRRCVDANYFAGLGRGAYAELGSHARSALASLYAELADAFEWLVNVLRAVRMDRTVPTGMQEGLRALPERESTRVVRVGQAADARDSVH